MPVTVAPLVPALPVPLPAEAVAATHLLVSDSPGIAVVAPPAQSDSRIAVVRLGPKPKPVSRSIIESEVMVGQY